MNCATPTDITFSFRGFSQRAGVTSDHCDGFGIAFFEDKLADYKRAKGSVQFPIDQPLPLKLVTEIVQLRVKQNLEKSVQKNKKKAR